MMSKFLQVLTVMVATFLVSMPALAEGGSGAGDGGGMIAIGAGLAIGLAACGAGMGQGRTGAAAVEGIARNPQTAGTIQTVMIIALALMESLAIYGLVIAFMLLGKI
jgi:F-type H+-transporting ATPase subunit c